MWKCVDQIRFFFWEQRININFFGWNVMCMEQLGNNFFYQCCQKKSTQKTLALNVWQCLLCTYYVHTR